MKGLMEVREDFEVRPGLPSAIVKFLGSVLATQQFQILLKTSGSSTHPSTKALSSYYGCVRNAILDPWHKLVPFEKVASVRELSDL